MARKIAGQNRIKHFAEIVWGNFIGDCDKVV
jgi:hypothetical protein